MYERVGICKKNDKLYKKLLESEKIGKFCEEYFVGE